MKRLRSLVIALSLYTAIPMPQVAWTEDAMELIFCFFPCGGILCGLGLGMVLFVCKAIGLSTFLRAVLCVLVPIAITGGIHLDGFCDTCDALGSHQERAKKLEILKDSHVGAFALMGCLCYLLLFTTLWAEVQVDSLGTALLLCLIPVLSRTLSGLCAVTMNNARGTGLLATVTHAAALRYNRIALAVWLLAVLAGMGLADLWPAVGVTIACGLLLLYYRRMSQREFGGITGDLEGWFLQLCELSSLAAVVLLQKLGGILL